MKKYLWLFVFSVLIWPADSFGQKKKKVKSENKIIGEVEPKDFPLTLPLDETKAVEFGKEKPFGKTGKYFLQHKLDSITFQTKFGITNQNGEIILPIIFNTIQEVIDDNVLVKLGNIYSLYNKDFEVVLPLEYLQIEKIEKSNFYLVQELTNLDFFSLIDQYGEPVFKNKNIGILPFFKFSNNQSSNYKSKYLKLINLITSKYGIYDANLKSVFLPTEYDEIKDFESGFIVYKDNTCNLLNKELKPAFKDNIAKISPISLNRFLVVKDGKKGLCKLNGEIIAMIDFDNIEIAYELSKFYKITKKSQVGLINENGEEICPMVYQNIKMVNNNYDRIVVKKNNKWGLLDISGKQLLSFLYDTLIIKYNLIIGKIGNNVYKVNIENGQNLKLNYQDIETFKMPTNKTFNFLTFKVNNNGKVGIVNSDLIEILATEYDSIEDFNYNESYYLVYKKGKVGLANVKGEFIFPIQYEKIFYAQKRSEFIIKSNGKYGLAFKNGSIIKTCECDYISKNEVLENEYFCIKNKVVYTIEVPKN